MLTEGKFKGQQLFIVDGSLYRGILRVLHLPSAGLDEHRQVVKQICITSSIAGFIALAACGQDLDSRATEVFHTVDKVAVEAVSGQSVALAELCQGISM